ncbi:ATP-binding protein [Streptomyces sp. NBC_01549]|uniref:ATP-binding protein n=1 Tax=Streptomyces sp. NBC_01549 TaxID=2975874 RepID=UPI00224DB6DB|nr:ATP-binding protein [Streptomyces sp. NBC_01549]MCX4588274.1 ATP-binding protein [Streptomyces sp. NBC_01549]
MTKVVLRGRTAEITSGLKLLRRTVRTDQGGVLFFQGPPGIGKSALLAEVISQAARMGFRCGVSKADQITDISPAAPLLLAPLPRGSLRATGSGRNAAHPATVHRTLDALTEAGGGPHMSPSGGVAELC